MSNLPLQAIFFRNIENDHIADILEETYLKKVYLPFVTGKTDLIIVDIGQNQGLTSFYFKDFAKRVIGLEPSSMHREIAKKMIEFNGIKNVEVLPYALSNKNGKERFYHNSNTTMFSLESSVNDKNDYEDVETITMEKLFEIAKIDHIDICKIDVEGSESRVICSPEFQKVADKIKVICGEWHSWDTQNKGAFMNMFRDLGFEFRWRTDTKASVFEAVRI
jgi:FkbM family methyltransferase